MKTLRKRLTASFAAIIMAAAAWAQATAPMVLSEMTSKGSMPYTVELDADNPEPYYIRPSQMVKNYILTQLGNNSSIDMSQVEYKVLLSEGVLTGDMTAPPDGFWLDGNGYACWPDGTMEYMCVECDRDSMNMKLTQRLGAYHQGDRDTLLIYATYNQNYVEFQLNVVFTDYNELAYQELQKQLKTLNQQTDKVDAKLPPLRNRHVEVRNTLDNTQAQAAQYGTKYDDTLNDYRFEVDTIGVEINNIQLRRYDSAINDAYQAGVLDQKKDSLSEEMTFYQETILPIITDQINSLTDRLNSLEASIQDLNNSMTAYDQEVAELQNRLVQLNQQSDEVMQRIPPLNEAYDDAQTHLTQVNARAKTYGTVFTESVNHEQSELQAIRADIDALQVYRFDGEVNQAIANNTVSEQKDTLMARMNNYADTALPAMNQQIDTITTRIATVDGNITAITANIDAYDVSAQELIQQNAQINQQNDSVAILYQAMQVNYNTTETRYNSVKADAAPYGDQFTEKLNKIEASLSQGKTNEQLLGDMFVRFDEPVNTAIANHTVLAVGDSLKEEMRVYSEETLPWMGYMIANNNQRYEWINQDLDTLSQSIYGAAYAELTAKQAELDAATALSDTLRAALIARYDAANEWHEEVSNAAADYNGRYDAQLAASRATLDSIKVQIDALPEPRYFGPEIEAANQAGQAEMKKDSLMTDMNYYLNVTLPALMQQMEQLSASITPLEIEFETMENTINAYYDIYDELIAEAEELNEKTQSAQAELLPPLTTRIAETDALIAQAEAEAQQYAPTYDDDIAAFRQRRDSINTAMQNLPFTDFTPEINAADSVHNVDLISDSLKAAMLSYETDTLRAIRQQTDFMNQQLDQLQADIAQLQTDMYQSQFAELRTMQQYISEVNARQQALTDTLKLRNNDISQHILELQNHVEPYGHKFDAGIAECNARVAAISQEILGIGYTDYNALIAAAERDDQLAQKKDSLMQQMNEYTQTLSANDVLIKQIGTEITATEALVDSVEDAVNNVWVTPVNGIATVTDPMGGLRNILQDQEQVKTLTILGQMMDDDFSVLSTMSALEQLELPEVNTNTDTLLLGGLKNLLTVTTTGSKTILKDYVFEGCNPNLIVYAPAGATVENHHCIAVIDGQAGVINLTDARSIRITQPFHAMQISYTRNFTKRTYVGESAGWESITLPFDVQEVKNADGKQINAFDTHPTEANAREVVMGDVIVYSDYDLFYWLAQIGSDGFTVATEINANVPYIIAMPNSLQYHDYMNVTGNVTFSAKDVEVQATTALTAYEGAYIFTPLYEANGQTDVFTINDQAYISNQPGSVFVRNMRAARPFEAYVTLKSGAKQRDYIRIADDPATGIASLTADTPALQGAPVYDLTGRRVAAPAKGIYIVGGKKVLVK